MQGSWEDAEADSDFLPGEDVGEAENIDERLGQQILGYMSKLGLDTESTVKVSLPSSLSSASSLSPHPAVLSQSSSL